MLSDNLKRGLDTLSPPQAAAVYHNDGPLLVVSGAGSGKTRTLTYRAARLIEEGCPPNRLLIATFTNRAASEFRERTTGVLGTIARDIWMGTLHSTGAKILRQHGTKGGYRKDFQILDQKQSLGLVIQAARMLNISQDECPAFAALERIFYWKERLISPNRVKDTGGTFDPWAILLYGHYQYLLHQKGAMDFSDLVLNAVQLLRKVPEVRSLLGLWFVLVDEYQDTDPAQNTLLNLLLPPTQNLTVVGDPDQAIYSWRGADPSIMLNFTKLYPGAKVISLGQNYRSTSLIVSAAAELIQLNKTRINHRIWSEQPLGLPIIIAACQNEEDETRRIVQHCRTLREQGMGWEEIAILYRTNTQSETLESAFVDAGIPYHVRGTQFFKRPEIEDVLHYLRVLQDPEDLESFQKCSNRPPRCITRDTATLVIQKAAADRQTVWEVLPRTEFMLLSNQAKKGLAAFREVMGSLFGALAKESLPDVVERVIVESGLRAHYEKRETEEQNIRGTSPTENLTRLVQVVNSQFGGPAKDVLPEFLTHIETLNEDGDTGVTDAVQLMTVHAAKGTEYRAIFVRGCEEGSFPHWHSLQSPRFLEAVEEERRLFYVSITRAREQLYLTWAKLRQTPGRDARPNSRSRFLDELPRQFVQAGVIGGK